jgi:DNA-binding XRE family transcriptional regulator
MCKPTLSSGDRSLRATSSAMPMQRRFIATTNVLGIMRGGSASSGVGGSTTTDIAIRHREQYQQQKIRRLQQYLNLQRGSLDRKIKELTHSQRFVLFIKTLIKIMEYCREDTVQAKQIVKECWSSSRENDIASKNENQLENDTTDPLLSLQKTITVKLREFVKDVYWNLTRDFLGYGYEQSGEKSD